MSLLIFCLEDLSIFDSGVLKSPTLIVLMSISFLKSSKIFLMYLSTLILGTYIFTIFVSSWWILRLSFLKWSSGSLYMALFLKSTLCNMSIATPASFPCPFAWKICVQPFTFSLCRSFVLRWVSCRQHMCGSCFLIHSAILCLLIGAFNHLHLPLLSIVRYSLPFFPFCVPLFLFSFLSLKQSL